MYQEGFEVNINKQVFVFILQRCIDWYRTSEDQQIVTCTCSYDELC